MMAEPNRIRSRSSVPGRAGKRPLASGRRLDGQQQRRAAHVRRPSHSPTAAPFRNRGCWPTPSGAVSMKSETDEAVQVTARAARPRRAAPPADPRGCCPGRWRPVSCGYSTQRLGSTPPPVPAPSGRRPRRSGRPSAACAKNRCVLGDLAEHQFQHLAVARMRHGGHAGLPPREELAPPHVASSSATRARRCRRRSAPAAARRRRRPASVDRPPQPVEMLVLAGQHVLIGVVAVVGRHPLGARLVAAVERRLLADRTPGAGRGGRSAFTSSVSLCR